MDKRVAIFKTYPELFLTLPISLIPLLIIILLRPFIQTKIYLVRSNRIGHFAADLELHLCEKKELNRKEISIFYFARSACNSQLAKMWKRKLLILPPFFMRPLDYIIRSIPFLNTFSGNTINYDRDVLNLYDKYPAQLTFTPQEEVLGKKKLVEIGIPKGSSFVCLIVRDGRYLNLENDGISDQKNTYRNSSIQNYSLAAENLASHGYFVLRMGALVERPLVTNSPKVIDYATNGSRSEFMDIYLGAKCAFCISTGTGFDAIPNIFRRPIVFVNYSPIEYLFTSRNEYISITRHYFSTKLNRELSLSEILKNGFGIIDSTFRLEQSGVWLKENTPEEISEVVMEMIERVKGSWKPEPGDIALQNKFWKIFKRDSRYIRKDSLGIPIHGEIRASFGSVFLRKNPQLLA